MDSYGDKPDEIFKYIPKKIRQKYNFTGKPYLSKLLINSPYKIEYNEIQGQKDGEGIATCGRHCIFRILLKDLPLETYQAIMQMFDGDELVTKLTNLII